MSKNISENKKIWSVYVDENEENQFMLYYSEAVNLAQKWYQDGTVDDDETIYLCNTETDEFTKMKRTKMKRTKMKGDH